MFGPCLPSERRRIGHSGAVILCALLWVVSALPTPAGEENLIRNPGFEEIYEPSRLPIHWRVEEWGSEKTRGVVALERSTDAQEGKSAARIRWTKGGHNIVLTPTFTEPVKGAHRLRLTFFYKFQGEGFVSASMFTRDEKGGKLQYEHSPKYKAVKDWTQVTWDFSTDPKTHELLVWLRTGRDDVLFDNVALVAPPPVIQNDIQPCILKKVEPPKPAEAEKP